jgi:hypothetical protein
MTSVLNLQNNNLSVYRHDRILSGKHGCHINGDTGMCILSEGVKAADVFLIKKN